MTRLSVNINKFATLRNARGGNNPDVVRAAVDIQQFGGEGITVHPRPDERHIRREDVFELKKVVTTEFNIEGYPDQRYLDIIEQVRPAQATLVPDDPEVLTSNAGWDTLAHRDFLAEMVKKINAWGVRVSLFVDPDKNFVEGAADTGAQRIELYTGPYAEGFGTHKEQALAPYVDAAEKAKKLGLGINAGHDLDLKNLPYLMRSIPYIDEVSIGHAIVCDALYLGLEPTIAAYLKAVRG